MSDTFAGIPLSPEADLAIKAEIAGYLSVWQSHPAWIKFFAPEFERAKQSAVDMLVHPSPKRLEVYSDDYLRARITIINELLTMGARYIDDYERQREQQQELQFDNVMLQQRTDLGHIGPMV